jgi:NADH-quinone oxidoreductase subunit E
MKTFSEAARQQAQTYMGLYPKKEAALLPILHLAQKEFGYIDDAAELAIAELMEISPISVREVSNFYFMYHHRPIGKYHFQVCHNISCSIMGAETILENLQKRWGIGDGQCTTDGFYSVERVECLACCDRGPALLINQTLHTNLTVEKLDEIIKTLS